MRQGGLVSPVTVGRASELNQLALELDEARLGRGRVTVLAGEAGVGKSRLAADVQLVARRLGMTVLHGRAVESEAPVPYRVIASAVLPGFRRAGPPDDPRLGPYRAALSLLVPEWADATRARHLVAHDTTLAVLEATGRLLSVLAGGPGLLIILEDLHWADAETVALANYLTDTVGEERVMCVFTVRAGEPGPARDLVERVRLSPNASLLTLQRLPPDALEDLLRATLATSDPPDGLADFVATQSEGVPLVVEELLADLRASGALIQQPSGWQYLGGGPARAPDGFRKLIERRIARLSPETGELLEAAATLGRQFEWSLLSTVSGLDHDSVLRALGEAVDAQLLSSEAEPGQAVQFRHALIRASVVDSLLPPRRVQLARAAARAVETAPGAMSAERLELAATLWQQTGDNASASRVLVALGRDALSRSALTSAESTLERAVALSTGALDTRADALELLSDALIRMGGGARCLDVTEQLMRTLLAIDAGRRRMHAAWLRLARATIGNQPAPDAEGGPAADNRRAAAMHALDNADDTGDDPADHAAVASLRAIVAVEVHELAIAETLATEAIALAERCGAAAPACEALYALARASKVVRPEAAIAPLTRALTIAERSGLEDLRLRLLLELGLAERMATGRTEHLCRARDLARECGALLTDAVACMNLGYFSHEETWPQAQSVQNLQEALRLSRRHRLPTLRIALCFQAIRLATEGDRNAFEKTLREIDEGDSHAAAPFIDEAALRFWWAACNEERAGLSAGLDAVVPLVDRLAACQAPMRGMFALASALLSRDAASACDRVETVGYGSALNEALVGMARAIVLGRQGRSDEAGQARIRAADKLDSREMHALAHRFVSEAAMRDGWGEPAAWLREALSCFEREHMARPARACTALLRQLGEPVRRRGRGDAAVPAELRALSVTSREMDVLLLLREGLSNAEVAERLFVSRRTVETHVSRLLAKTGTATRGRLAAFPVADHGTVRRD